MSKITRRKKRKKLFFLTVLSVFFLTEFVNSTNFEDLLLIQDETNHEVKAISDIICKFYIEQDIKFDFFIYGESSNKINKIVEKLTKEISQKKAVSLKQITEISSWDHHFMQSSIIFIKSQEVLYKFYELMQKFIIFVPEKFKFFIFCEEINSFQNLFDISNLNKRIILKRPTDLRFFEFFITSDDNFINLTANVLYSESKCEEFIPQVLNSYDKKITKWQRKLENFNHFGNFHGCLLKFNVPLTRSFYIKDHKDVDYDTDLQTIFSSKDVEFGGILNEIVEMLSKRYNFSFHYTIMRLSFPNVTRDGKDNFISSRESEIFLFQSFQSSNVDHLSIFDLTEPIGVFKMYYLITPNDYYTNYEKLKFIFDLTTWLLLGLTLSITFGTIFVLYLCPHWMRDVVFGKSK